MAGRSSHMFMFGLVLAALISTGLAPAIAADAPVPQRRTDVNARLVTSEGLSQWINCQGAGPLTLVVIAGLGAASSQWSQVRPEMANLIRTCVYDRPGLGQSPNRISPNSSTDAGKQAKELHSLLAAAAEPGPYVVVGHSYGGLIARSFVRKYQQEVSGLLLMEGVDPRSEGGSHYWHEAGLAVDMVRSRTAARGDLGLQNKPLVVVSASNPGRDHLHGPTYGESAEGIATWRAEQQSTIQLSNNAIRIVAHSGHVVQQDNPKATLEAIRELLASASTNDPLRCSPVWKSLTAICTSNR